MRIDPVVGRHEAEDHLEQRALAGAVRAAQAEELADRHVERDVVEHDFVAEPLRHADHLEDARRILGRQRSDERHVRRS